MLPVATTGATSKSPLTPMGMPGEAELMPRTVTVNGVPAPLLAAPVPETGRAPPSPGVPAQISLGKYQVVFLV